MSSSSLVMWSQPPGPASEAALTEALAALGWALQELTSQDWEPESSTIGGVRDIDTSFVAAVTDGWSSVLLHLNADFAADLATALSRDHGRALLFEEHQDSMWGYTYFDAGTRRDAFFSDPIWLEQPEEALQGDPAALGAAFGVPPEQLAPYFRHHPIPDRAKAFPDDEFELADHWVRCDLMQRLGLPYPGPGEAEGRHVQLVRA